jgi:hypothetical protein
MGTSPVRSPQNRPERIERDAASYPYMRREKSLKGFQRTEVHLDEKQFVSKGEDVKADVKAD